MFRNGGDGFGGGGGFDVSGFGGTGETPQADKKGPRRSDCIIPVTVRQVLESTGTGLKIGQMDVEAQMVKLVGIIKQIERSSVKVIYTLEDNTGAIEGIHWIEADVDDTFVVPVVENTYCAMIGSIRNTTAQHNKRHIMVFQIFSIMDLNEITAFTLQVIQMSLKSDDLTPQMVKMPAAKQVMNSTYGGGTDNQGGFNHTLTPAQMIVLRAVAEMQTEGGTHVDEIANALTVKMPRAEVMEIINFLSSEGHIYSTSDDCHFRATD